MSCFIGRVTDPTDHIARKFHGPKARPSLLLLRAWLAIKTHTQAKLLKATEDHPLPGGFKHGVAFESYILHAPNYLAHLADGLRARGVPIIRRRLASIDEAFDLPETGRVDIVVNALGLGNKTLIGVMDDKMHPAQGQTVLVKAPLVNTCTMATGDTVKTKKEGEGPGVLSYEAEGVSESGRTHAGDNGQNVRALCNAIAHDDDDAISTTAAPSTSGRTPGTSADIPGDPEAIAYIIPRPGHEGHVVCGGTYNKDNWITQPNMAEAERILRACYALDPRLAGPNSKSWQDIEVVSHNVGLRPSRVGGVRLELERRIVGGTSQPLAPRSRTDRQRGVAVVHAYGPGGTGYQSSIGLAQKAGDIVVAQMRATPAAPKL